MVAFVRSMVSTLTAAGVDPDEIDIDTLADRIYAGGGDQQISAMGPFIGVWARKPEQRIEPGDHRLIGR
jgi:hypothetical protein